jgi:hypothetical protein
MLRKSDLTAGGLSGYAEVTAAASCSRLILETSPSSLHPIEIRLLATSNYQTLSKISGFFDSTRAITQQRDIGHSPGQRSKPAQAATAGGPQARHPTIAVRIKLALYYIAACGLLLFHCGGILPESPLPSFSPHIEQAQARQAGFFQQAALQVLLFQHG